MTEQIKAPNTVEETLFVLFLNTFSGKVRIGMTTSQLSKALDINVVETLEGSDKNMTPAWGITPRPGFRGGEKMTGELLIRESFIRMIAAIADNRHYPGDEGKEIKVNAFDMRYIAELIAEGDIRAFPRSTVDGAIAMANEPKTLKLEKTGELVPDTKLPLAQVGAFIRTFDDALLRFSAGGDAAIENMRVLADDGVVIACNQIMDTAQKLRRPNVTTLRVLTKPGAERSTYDTIMASSVNKGSKSWRFSRNSHTVYLDGSFDHVFSNHGQDILAVLDVRMSGECIMAAVEWGINEKHGMSRNFHVMLDADADNLALLPGIDSAGDTPMLDGFSLTTVKMEYVKRKFRESADPITGVGSWDDYRQALADAWSPYWESRRDSDIEIIATRLMQSCWLYEQETNDSSGLVLDKQNRALFKAFKRLVSYAAHIQPAHPTSQPLQRDLTFWKCLKSAMSELEATKNPAVTSGLFALVLKDNLFYRDHARLYGFVSMLRTEVQYGLLNQIAMSLFSPKMLMSVEAHAYWSSDVSK